MRKALSLLLLVCGSILYAVAWAPSETWALESLLWTSTGAALLLLGWGVRSEYEPLALLAAGSLAGVVFDGLVGFNEIATSGGQARPEYLVVLRSRFAWPPLIAILGLARAALASSRPRGTVLCWVVVIQGSWWAWYLESTLILPYGRAGEYVPRGWVALAWTLFGGAVLAGLFVGWLRRTSRPKLARVATSFSTVVILAFAVRGYRKLETDEELFEKWWNVPVSDSGERDPPPVDEWRPAIEVANGGEVFASHMHLTPDQFRNWLMACRRRMEPGERIRLQADSGETYASIHPILRTLLDLGPPFEEVRLVVRDRTRERDWREIVADALPFAEGQIPLVLDEAAPAGVAEISLGLEGADPAPGGLREVVLRIDPRVGMDRFVATLDRLRHAGCTKIHVLVAAE